MNNILINFASHEMNQSILVTDLSKLDTDNSKHKVIKDAIEWMLSPEQPDSFKKFDWLECDKPDGVYDTNGYEMHNILQDLFGFPEVPYTVEHHLFVRCHV